MLRNIEVDGWEPNTPQPQIHVRHDGVSKDIILQDLNIANDTPDTNVKVAVANWLDIEQNSFEKFVIERHDNGDMTLRPEAVFG